MLLLLPLLCVGQVTDTPALQASENGGFRAGLSCREKQIPLGKLHSWVLHIETPEGKPIEKADILMRGGMPQHGHGFPSEPRVTRYLGKGDYLIEGVKFNMSGQWLMQFIVTHDEGSEQISFYLEIEV